MTALTICVLLVVIFFLPESKLLDPNQVSEESLTTVLDSNLRLLILIGTLVFTAFAIIQSVTAFYLQDKFSLDYYQTASATAMSLGAMAISSILVQLTFVQRFSGASLRLLQFSLPFFAAGSLVVIASSDFIFIVVGMSLVGLGMGLASPGYTATASLNSNSTNQGAAVGLAMVAPGLGFTIGPISGGFLYEINHIFPFVIILPILLVIYLIMPSLNLKK